MSSTADVADCESENEPRLAKKRRSSIIKHESTEVSVLTEKDNNRKSESGQRKSLRGVRRVSFASTDQVREFCQDDAQHVQECTKMREAVEPVQSENTSMVLNKHTKPAVQCFQTFVRGAIPDLSQNDQSIASGNTTANLAMTPQQVVEKCDFKDVMMRLNLCDTTKWSNASSISSAVECADPSGTIKQAGQNQSLFKDGGVYMDPSQPNPPKRRCQLQPLVSDDPFPLAFIPTLAGIKYEQVLEPKPGAAKNTILLGNEIIDTTRCRTMDFSGKQAEPKDAGQFFVPQTCAVEKTFMFEDGNMATRGCHIAASSEHQVGLEVKSQVFVPNAQTLELPTLFEHTKMSPTKSYTEAFVQPQSQPNAPSQVLEPQICGMVHSVLYGDENMDLTKCHTAAFSESQPSLVVPQSGVLDKTTVFEDENMAMTGCHTMALSDHQTELDAENVIFGSQTHEVKKTVGEDKKMDTSLCSLVASFEPQPRSWTHDQLLVPQTVLDKTTVFENCNMDITRCHSSGFSATPPRVEAPQGLIVEPQTQIVEIPTPFEHKEMNTTKSCAEIFPQPQPRPNVPSEVLVPQISAMEHSVVYGDENMEMTKCHTAAFSKSQPSLVAQSVVVPQSGALDKTTAFEDENMAMTRCHTVTLSEHQIGLDVENLIFVPQTREVEKTTVTEDKKTDTSRCSLAATFEPQTQSKADQLLVSQISAMEHTIMYGDENMEMTKCNTAAFSESQTSLVAQSVVVVPQSGALEKTTVFEDENMAMTGCHTMALSEHQIGLDAENLIFVPQTREVEKTTVTEDKKMNTSQCCQVASFEPQTKLKADQLLVSQTSAMEHSVLYGDENMDITKCHTAAFSESQSSFVAQGVVVPQTGALDKTTVFEDENMAMTGCHTVTLSEHQIGLDAENLIFVPQTREVEKTTVTEDKKMDTSQCRQVASFEPQTKLKADQLLVSQTSAMEHTIMYGDENMDMTKCHTAAFSESQSSLVAQGVVPQTGALDKTTVFEDENMALTGCHTVTLSEHQIGLDAENLVFVPRTREVEKTTVTEDTNMDTSHCHTAAVCEPQTKLKADQLLMPLTDALLQTTVFENDNMDMTKCDTSAFSTLQPRFVAQSLVVGPETHSVNKTLVFEGKKMNTTMSCAETFDQAQPRQNAPSRVLVPQTSAMEHSIMHGDENLEITRCHTAALSESQPRVIAQSVAVVPQTHALDKTTVFEDENMAMTGCHTMALSERQTGLDAENLIFVSQTREAEKTTVTEDKNMDMSRCYTAAFFEAQPRLKADELLVPLTGALLQTTVFLNDNMDMTKCDTSAFYPSRPRFEAQSLIVGPETPTLKKTLVFENKEMNRTKSYTETIPQSQPWLNAPSQVFVPQTSAMEHSVMYGDENMEMTRCHTAAFSESQPRLIAQSGAFVPHTRALDKTTMFDDRNMSVTACNTAAFYELQTGLEAESRILVSQTCADEHAVMFKDVNVTKSHIKAFSQPQPRANPPNELFESQNSSVKHAAVMPRDENMKKMCGLIGFARAETTLQAEDEIFLPQMLHPPQPVIFDKVNVDTTSNNIGALLESHLGSKTGAVYVPKTGGVMIAALFKDEDVDTRKLQREGSSKLQAGLKAEGRVFLPPTRAIQCTGLIGNEDVDTMQSRTATELQPEIKAVIENLDTTGLSRRQHDGRHVERSSKYRPKVVEPSLPGENKNCSSYSHQNIGETSMCVPSHGSTLSRRTHLPGLVGIDIEDPMASLVNVDGVSDFGISSESMPCFCDATLGNTGDFASAAYDQDAECSLSKTNSIGDKEGIQSLEVLMQKLFADLWLHVSDIELKHKSPACLTEQTQNSEQIQGVTGSLLKSHLPGSQCSTHQLFMDDLAQKFAEFETSIAKHDGLLSRLNGRLTERQVTRLSDELPVAMSGLYRKAEGAYAALHKHYLTALCMKQQVELEDLQKKSATANELICDLQRAMKSLLLDEMKKETISSVVLSKTQEIHSLKAEKADVKARRKEQQKKNTELTKELQEIEQELVKPIHSKTDYWGLSEWRLVNWDDNEAIFSFFFDSLVLTISFGRPLDTELCPAQLHMEVTKVNLVSFLDETHASDFACLMHRLLFSSAHMSEWQSQCGDTNQLSQLLLTVSTRVNVARSLFEELEALECNSFDMELFSIKVEELWVSFVFSSLPAYAKFAVIFNVTPAYPHEQMHFEFRPMIGNVSEMDVKKAVEAETPGRYYLWRLVNQVYHSVLLPRQKKCSTANEPC